MMRKTSSTPAPGSKKRQQRQNERRRARKELLATGEAPAALPPEGGRRVDFVIGGAQKGGTTALHAYLQQHPHLFLPERKELHFFDHERPWRRGRKNGYRGYHKLFARAPEGALWGEATPAYMYYYDVPRRIWEYNPQMKWIIILRNPVERAYSHWNMNRERGKEPLTFGEAIRSERERCRVSLPRQHRSKTYVDRGFYLEQIRRVWHFFPPAQVHIVKSERLRAGAPEVLSEISAFLGVPPMTSIEPLTAHARKYTTAMDEADRQHLKSIYEFSIRDLERVLGWDCADWLKK